MSSKLPLTSAASMVRSANVGSRRHGSTINYEKGLELFKKAARHLADCSDSIPLLGNFAAVLKKLLDVSDTMKLNKENARSFSVTLFDTAILVDEGVQLVMPLPNNETRATKVDIISRIISDLHEIMENAVSALGDFSKKGFLGRLLAGNNPSSTFSSYDAEITRKLREFSTALAMAQLSLSEQTYNAVSSIEKWCSANGGLAEIFKDHSKAVDLANELGSTVDDIRDELVIQLARFDQIDSRLETVLANQEQMVDIVKNLVSRPLDVISVSGKANNSSLYPSVSWPDLIIDHLHPLGAGGFGTVYSGSYKREQVAIKTFHATNTVLDTTMIRDFTREISIMYAVRDHPNILKLIAANLTSTTKDRPPCIVLELADGSLHDALYNHKIKEIDLSVQSKLHMLVEIADAFSFIGEQCNIVFRDLKPMNILLKNNHVKIADFGLAKRDVDQTTMSAVKGTERYMSPEALRGDPLSWKTDVWSFGRTIDETLSNKPAFAGKGKQQIYNDVVVHNNRDMHFSASSASDYVGCALVKVIAVCLNKDSHRRPNFSSLAVDLRKVLKASVDIARSGSTSTYYLKPFELVSASSNSKTPLASLTVDDVVVLFDSLNMVPDCAVAIRREKIDGRVLSLVGKHEDFNINFELGLKPIKSMALMESINEFKIDGGVPSEIILPTFTSSSSMNASSASASESLSPSRSVSQSVYSGSLKVAGGMQSLTIPAALSVESISNALIRAEVTPDASLTDVAAILALVPTYIGADQNKQKGLGYTKGILVSKSTTVIDSILKIVVKYSGSTLVCEKAFEAISKLTRLTGSSETSCKHNIERVGSTIFFEHVPSIITKHISDEALVEQGLTMIRNLSIKSFDLGLHTVCFHKRIVTSARATLISALQLHGLTNATITKMACVTVSNTVENGDLDYECSHWFTDSGACEVLMDVLKGPFGQSNAEVARIVCITIYRLIYFGGNFVLGNKAKKRFKSLDAVAVLSTVVNNGQMTAAHESAREAIKVLTHLS